MDQLTLFPLPYKYIMDTSAVLSQKPNEPHRRSVYRGLWERIEGHIRDHVIVICSEVKEEIKDDTIKDWISQNNCLILDIDESIQINVRKIVTENPTMIEFTGKSGTSSGDAFLIATAMKYNLVVVTEENKKKETKIPKICEKYGITAINLTELCEIENWKFY